MYGVLRGLECLSICAASIECVLSSRLSSAMIPLPAVMQWSTLNRHIGSSSIFGLVCVKKAQPCVAMQRDGELTIVRTHLRAVRARQAIY